MANETQAMRPVSKAVNDALGKLKLPSGPFNFGLYFNKWMYVVDGRYCQERLPDKGWACCGADETKLVRNREKVCDPNQLLDNLDVSICLFNRDQSYRRKLPKEQRGKDGNISYKEDESAISMAEKWDWEKSEKLLKAKHVSLDKSAVAYHQLGYEVLTCRARLLSSLVIGLGNEHPTEKGFRFDWTLGVPFIPATGLKGVVRLAFLVNRLNELDETAARTFWGRITKGLLEDDAKKLFGCSEDAKNGQRDQRGGIVFFDAYPEELPRFAPEIMNCHYPDYLNKQAERGPTEDQQLNPQKYWAVSPWLDKDRKKPLHFIFRMLVPKKLTDGPYNEKFRDALQDALYVHGLGAKTAIGHGRFNAIFPQGEASKNPSGQTANNTPAHSITDSPLPAGHEAVMKEKLDSFRNGLPKAQDLASRMEEIVKKIRTETDETLRKEMCQILLDLARADKKKFKAAVKDGKQWAKKLIDLCKEQEVE